MNEFEFDLNKPVPMIDLGDSNPLRDEVLHVTQTLAYYLASDHEFADVHERFQAAEERIVAAQANPTPSKYQSAALALGQAALHLGLEIRSALPSNELNFLQQCLLTSAQNMQAAPVDPLPLIRRAMQTHGNDPAGAWDLATEACAASCCWARA